MIPIASKEQMAKVAFDRSVTKYVLRRRRKFMGWAEPFKLLIGKRPEYVHYFLLIPVKVEKCMPDDHCAMVRLLDGSERVCIESIYGIYI